MNNKDQPSYAPGEGAAIAHAGDEAEAAIRQLTPAAKRALQEAAQRRKAEERLAASRKKQTELGGRGGPEPTRFGDWEKRGIISDF
ncbi:MAG: DUF1674 domain-containing protein [Alphaproteobacteria bacterium]|nr:DUF1674 domain-containing protein [Alphaproteobacteria bacterium]